MANINLTQTLLNTSLNTFALPSEALGFANSIPADIDSVIQVGGGFDSEPLVSGNTYVYKDPTYVGEAGEYRFIGTMTNQYAYNGELQSASGSFSGTSITTDTGTLTLKGSVKAQISVTKTAYSLSYRELAFAGTNGSVWTLKGSLSASYSYDEKTDNEIVKYATSITSISSTDTNKNNLTLSGSLKYAAATDSWSGFVTTMSVTLNGLKLSATGLKITYEALNTITALGTIADWMPIILSGNDTITVSGTDAPGGVISGFAGNDKITGSSNADNLLGDAAAATIWGNDVLSGGDGNDTLNGGGGMDKLTGGGGADTFVLDFSKFDFTTVKTAKLVTVTDFKSTEGDQLQLTGFAKPVQVASIKELKGNTIASTVVYESSTGKFWYDADSAIGSGTPTVNFAKVVGVPTDYFA